MTKENDIDSISLKGDGLYYLLISGGQELGVFKVFDPMRGWREDVKMIEINDKWKVTLTQNLLGVSYDLYNITPKENPEYFL